MASISHAIDVRIIAGAQKRLHNSANAANMSRFGNRREGNGLANHYHLGLRAA